MAGTSWTSARVPFHASALTGNLQCFADGLEPEALAVELRLHENKRQRSFT